MALETNLYYIYDSLVGQFFQSELGWLVLVGSGWPCLHVWGLSWDNWDNQRLSFCGVSFSRRPVQTCLYGGRRFSAVPNGQAPMYKPPLKHLFESQQVTFQGQIQRGRNRPDLLMERTSKSHCKGACMQEWSKFVTRLQTATCRHGKGSIENLGT